MTKTKTMNNQKATKDVDWFGLFEHWDFGIVSNFA